MSDEYATDYLCAIQFFKRIGLGFDCRDLEQIVVPFQNMELQFNFNLDGEFTSLERGP